MRRPLIQVISSAGRDMVPLWGAALASVSITDQAGYESDQAVLTFRDTPPRWQAPPKGTRYEVRLGWSTDSMAVTGIYTVQRVGFSGSPDEGTAMRVTCRAADFLDKMKEVDTEHFDGKTVGEIVKDLAGRMGVAAVVAPALAGIAIPYRMRFQQSIGDFLTHLADQVGGIIKPQAGKLLVLQRGSGQSAGGKTLPAITVTHDPLYEFEAETEPRSQFKDVEGGWIDPKTGLRTAARRSGGYAASRTAVVHPFPSKDEAELGADAAAQEQGRKSATARFSMPGEPRAVAEARVIAKGFGADIDSVAWVASSVSHEARPDQGWRTEIECETKGKGSESDDDD
jgi:phage protein D